MTKLFAFLALSFFLSRPFADSSLYEIGQDIKKITTPAKAKRFQVSSPVDFRKS